METTKGSESTKGTEKQPKDGNTIADMYSKQLNLVTGFYTSFFDSLKGPNKAGPQDKGFAGMFPHTDFIKLFSNPFTGTDNGFQNSFIASVEKVYSQMADYNRDLFSAFTLETKNSNVDFTGISKKYKDTIDSRIEASKNVLKSAGEAYNKHYDSAIENNKKMMEEINTQFSSVVKQTQKFWDEALQSTKEPLTEEDLNVKEPTPGEVKKKSNTPPLT